MKYWADISNTRKNTVLTLRRFMAKDRNLYVIGQSFVSLMLI